MPTPRKHHPCEYSRPPDMGHVLTALGMSTAPKAIKVMLQAPSVPPVAATPSVPSEGMYNICYMDPHAPSGMGIYGPWCEHIWAHPYLVWVCIIFVIWAHTSGVGILGQS